jgi:ABC-type amino acid transport substrate-binding protein
MKRLAGVIAAAIVLAAWVWFGREAPVVAPSLQPLQVSTAEPQAPRAPAATTSSLNRKLAELRAMSPTFLASTLLIAIRDAGFVCEDVVNVDQSGPDSPVWRAHCRDLKAYLVRVADSGALAVEPTLDQWDAVTPPPQMPVAPPSDLTGPRNPRR